jgi:hypothetical protein
MTVAYPPSPRSLSEHRVAAELSGANDILMATHIRVVAWVETVRPLKELRTGQRSESRSGVVTRHSRKPMSALG